MKVTDKSLGKKNNEVKVTSLEKNIAKLCEIKKCTEEAAKAELKKGKEYGISYAQYLRKKCYTLSDDELSDMGNVLAELKTVRNNNKMFYIKMACGKYGLDTINIVTKMSKAKKLGISELKYVQNDCWKKSDEELERLGRFLTKDKIRIRRNKNNYIKKICEITGWSEGKAELEVNRAKANCESSYEDYYAFKMYKLTKEEQKKYVTFGLFTKMRLKYNDHTIGRRVFDNKIEFNKTFSDLINHKWFSNKGLSYEEFLDKTKDLDYIFVKPIAATQGIGIRKYKCHESEQADRDIYNELIGLQECIVEEYIIQHEDVMKFCPSSVNTLRIMTLNHKGQCKFLYSVFRMGRGAIVDNFHAGGIAAAVDVTDGTVYTNAADLDGNTFEINPATGMKIKGFKIPNWDMILDTCKRASGRVEGVNLVGWDFAITPNGVDLIEGNPGASYIVAQIPNVEDGIGLRNQMVGSYLED